MLKAVLFDFDQTVINSVEGFRSAEHWLQGEMFNFLHLADWESFIATYREFRGKRSADTPEQKSELWRGFCRQLGTDPGEARLHEWRDAYWSCVESGSTLFPERLRSTFDGLYPPAQSPFRCTSSTGWPRAKPGSPT